MEGETGEETMEEESNFTADGLLCHPISTLTRQTLRFISFVSSWLFVSSIGFLCRSWGLAFPEGLAAFPYGILPDTHEDVCHLIAKARLPVDRWLNETRERRPSARAGGF